MALQRLRDVRLRVPKIKGLAFFKTPAVGLDIGRAVIKAVQVSRSPRSFALQHVGYRKLPAGAVSDGEVAYHALLSYEIKEFWASHSFKAKAVYLGVASQTPTRSQQTRCPWLERGGAG